VYDWFPVYDMSPTYDNSERPFDKASTMKNLLKSYLELIKDETTLSVFRGMINRFVQDKEAHVSQ
jgi:hypothetical protein